MTIHQVFHALLLQWMCTLIVAFAMPKLPGLYQPQLCLPMTDHSYPGGPDGDLSEEVIIANWNQETLFCKRGCCGDSKEAKCCPEEPEEGLGTFELISIVATGIAGITVVSVTALYFIKKHNKNKVLVHDINNINKANGKGGKHAGKVGQYQKGPSSQSGGQQQLFTKSKIPPVMKRPKTPISILSPPDILPTIVAGPGLGGGGKKPNALDFKLDANQTSLNTTEAPSRQLDAIFTTQITPAPPSSTLAGPTPKLSSVAYLPGINQMPQKPVKAPSPVREEAALIADLKAPSPSAANPNPASPAPSPPLPENLPPPLISPPMKTANLDDDFIDSLLASIPLKDPATPKY